MNVLIKGMEMPKSCDMCILAVPVFDYAKRKIVSICLPKNNNGCPLVEVPTPHGRLIDADEFIKKRNLGYECEGCIHDGECNYDFSFTRMELCSWIEDAPTVIEADNK